MVFQPSATIEVLKKRAQLLHELRAFFYARDVMELDVPVLGLATVTDPFIESLSIESSSVDAQSPLYLQTSPEFYLKRAIAAGVGDVYYLGPAFRKEEMGRLHKNEFTMLEWYRVGFDDDQLIAEIALLLQSLLPSLTYSVLEYGDVFESALSLNPHAASVDQLREASKQRCDIGFDSDLKSVWLDFLFSYFVEPTLPDQPTFVKNFPVELGALARFGSNDQGQHVAKRFELYWQGKELANGYWELTDVQEQRKRMVQDNDKRRGLGLRAVTPDEKFLAALDHGLPSCAGVALGVDRLLMCLQGANDIADVMSFGVN